MSAKTLTGSKENSNHAVLGGPGGKGVPSGDQSGARPAVYGWQSNVLCSTHRQRPSGPDKIASCRTAGPAGRVAPRPTHRGAARQGISSHARTTTPLGEAQAAVTFSFFSFFLQIPSTPVSPERETGLSLAGRFSMRVRKGCNGFGINRRPKTDLLEGLCGEVEREARLNDEHACLHHPD